MTDFLQTPSSSAALSSGGVGRDGGDVFYAADLEARASQGADGGLGAWAGSLGAVTTSGSHLDVNRCNS